MEERKFGLLNIQKKQNVTHADIQKTSQTKKGGRPKKSDAEKLRYVVSINLNTEEKKTLEKEAEDIGISILSLVRLSISKALKNNFESKKTKKESQKNKTAKDKNKKVIQQYAIPVTQTLKKNLEYWSNEFMISMSNLLKIALKNEGYLDI